MIGPAMSKIEVWAPCVLAVLASACNEGLPMGQPAESPPGLSFYGRVEMLGFDKSPPPIWMEGDLKVAVNELEAAWDITRRDDVSGSLAALETVSQGA